MKIHIKYKKHFKTQTQKPIQTSNTRAVLISSSSRSQFGPAHLIEREKENKFRFTTTDEQ